MKRATCVSVALLFIAMTTAAIAGCGGSGVPTINSISPASGPPMTEILIYGSGFGKSGGMNKVEFNGDAIGIKTWSDTEIVATVPIGTKAGTYQVTVVTEKATSEPLPFEVTDASSAPGQSGQTQANTQKEVVVSYCDANNLWHPDAQVKEGQKEDIKLVKASSTDATWELWSMPAGQGEDIYYFLLRKEGEDWNVLKGGFWENETPQQYGAPSDITIPPPAG
jgi:IPT/TIG domain